MGAAQTKNIATATSNVANSVVNTTSVNSAQIDNKTQVIDFVNCIVQLDGDLDIEGKTKTAIVNHQIANVNSSTGLNNDVQQSAVQEALSKVGALGVGYAEAVNNTSMFCSITNDIVNQVSLSAKQGSTSKQKFQCNDSTIIAKNMRINFDNASEFYNSQILDNDNVADVTNSISQSIKQKASATVEGLAGFLLGLALIIAAVGYAIAKPLSSGSTKIIIAAIVVVVLLMIGSMMYIRKTPPFFAEPTVVAVNSSLKPDDCDRILKQSMRTIHVKKAPLKYMIALPGGKNSTGIADGTDLARLIIAGAGGKETNNSGYNMNTYTNIQNEIEALKKKLNLLNGSKLDVELKEIIKVDIPNLLVNPTNGKYIQIPEQFMFSTPGGSNVIKGSCTPGIFRWALDGESSETNQPPSKWKIGTCPIKANWNKAEITTDLDAGLAHYNKEGIENWIRKVTTVNKNKGLAYVRFVLLYLFNRWMPSESKIDLNIYQMDWELVGYLDENREMAIDIASEVDSNKLQKFVPDSEIDYFNGSQVSGELTLYMGTCDNRQYRFNNGFKVSASTILSTIIFIAIIYFIAKFIMSKKK